MVEDFQSDLAESGTTASTKTIKRALNYLVLMIRRTEKTMKSKRLNWARSLKDKDLNCCKSLSFLCKSHVKVLL